MLSKKLKAIQKRKRGVDAALPARSQVGVGTFKGIKRQKIAGSNQEESKGTWNATIDKNI